MRDGDQAQREEDIIRNALTRGVAKGVADAFLVDEGQDFRPSWLKLVKEAVRPGRGGILIAMDSAQSIYQVTRLDELFPQEVDWVYLNSNYRNTRQIGEFAYSTIFPSRAVLGEHTSSPNRPIFPVFRLEGEPVQTVWAESWNAAGRFHLGRDSKARPIGEGRLSRHRGPLSQEIRYDPPRHGLLRTTRSRTSF